MKITKQCPECGGREIYKAKAEINGHTMGLLPQAWVAYETHPEIYVCAECGYYRMFLEPKTIEKVKEKYELCQ